MNIDELPLNVLNDLYDGRVNVTCGWICTNLALYCIFTSGCI